MRTDILVVGAGSGGIAAAYTASKYAPDKSVLLIEAQAVPGGTSVTAGVNAWEPGCAGYGAVHRILYDKLATSGDIHIGGCVKRENEPFCHAFTGNIPGLTYEGTFTRKGQLRAVFHPDAMAAAMGNLLYSQPNLTVIYSCTLTEVRAYGGRIASVRAYRTDCQELLDIEASLYIDATADIVMARMAGCRAEMSDDLNGVTQLFAVEKKSSRGIDPVPRWVLDTEAPAWIDKQVPAIQFNIYPDGRINANPLPTLDGKDFLKLGQGAKRAAVARTYVLWNTVQRELGMDDYRLCQIFGMLGVRETYRLRGRYVLTVEELRKGHRLQERRDSFIAFSDHALDRHGSADGELCELEEYYGIPYDCCLTDDAENLAVACRGISLTHGAAASCRLQRTIMQVGEAVGIAAAKAVSVSGHASFLKPGLFTPYEGI